MANNQKVVAVTAQKDIFDLRSTMEEKMTQLRALTCLISGGGHENFQSYSDEVQNNVLWLTNSLAGEIQDLYEDISRVPDHEKQK